MDEGEKKESVTFASAYALGCIGFILSEALTILDGSSDLSAKALMAELRSRVTKPITPTTDETAA